MDIVRAAEVLALSDTAPPKSPAEHHDQDKIQKTTTVVISKHTLDTQPSTQQLAVTPVPVTIIPQPSTQHTSLPLPQQV